MVSDRHEIRDLLLQLSILLAYACFHDWRFVGLKKKKNPLL